MRTLGVFASASSALRFLFDLYVRSGPPLLVYQMGKVGSMSVARSLRAAGCHRVFRTHRLVPRNYRRNPPGQRVVSSLLRRRFVLDDSSRLRIVSPVRDPVPRNVSGFFQNLDRFVEDPVRTPVPELQRLFVERYPHDVGLNWFDDELRAAFGIDVFAHPFDPSLGHATIGKGRVELLLFRIELADDRIARLLADFVGADALVLLRANDAAARGARHGRAYDEFRRTLVLPEALAGSIYASKYARHFYSSEERRAARARWTAAPLEARAPCGAQTSSASG